MNDPAVGRRENDVLKIGDFSPWIPEEISDKERKKDPQSHPGPPPQNSKDHR
jgi:hypothetical protein